MKLKEFLVSTPIKTEDNIPPYRLSQHINCDFSLEDIHEMNGISFHYFIDECFDGERGLAVFRIDYNGNPIAICFEGGRANRDEVETYIIDPKSYYTLIADLFQAYLNQASKHANASDLNIDVDGFYGRNISEFYSTELTPKYKVGDCILAYNWEHAPGASWYEEKSMKVERKCRIVGINQFNPSKTYDVKLIDCAWEYPRVVSRPGSFTTGTIAEQDVIKKIDE